jgi:hypothetical protein
LGETLIVVSDTLRILFLYSTLSLGLSVDVQSLPVFSAALAILDLYPLDAPIQYSALLNTV